MFKVIIAGTRTFNDYPLLVSKMDSLLRRKTDITIISGTARGADRMGEDYANLRKYPLIRVPANWDLYGNSAGYKRNEIMAQQADAAVIFWDGISKGSKNMIDLCEQYNLKYRIVNY